MRTRQGDLEAATDLGVADHDLALVRFHDAAGNGQS
jgi:hypothetical protein